MIERVLRVRFPDSRNETIWLTIYADLITNLALLFLALFGVTLMGESALKEAILSMDLRSIGALKESKTPMQSAVDEIEKRLAGVPHISLMEKSGAARLALGESALFESGSAKLRPGAGELLSQVSTALQSAPFTIVVEGYTDDRPVLPGTAFRDNWELSLMRSMVVVRELISEGGLPADKVAAAAYGPHRPRATNATTAGRALNRRVEIAIFDTYRYPHSPGNGP